MDNFKVKNDNYVTIQGWMVSQLKLKGNELLIYAIIYMFSQTENQKFNGSRQFLADWTNSTKQGVDKNIKSLLSKKYIEKKDVYINNVKHIEYWTTKFSGVDNKVCWGGQQSLHKIKEEIKEDNKEIYKESFETFWETYPKKENKKDTEKWFSKNKPNKELLNKILDGIEKWKKTEQWKDKKYIPLPSTFLNKEKWNDEVEEVKETKKAIERHYFN